MSTWVDEEDYTAPEPRYQHTPNSEQPEGRAWNKLAEQALLIAGMYAPRWVELAFEEENVRPAHFFHPAYQLVWQALIELLDQGADTGPAALVNHLRPDVLDQVGGANWLVWLYGGGDTGSVGADERLVRTNARAVRTMAAVRRGKAGVLELQEAMRGGIAPEELTDRLRVLADDLDNEVDTGDADDWSVNDLVDAADQGYQWLIPDAIEVGDTVMVTGASGSGKSILALQVAVQVAAGVDPFHAGRRMAPRRALYIQAENGPREDGRRMARMVDMARRANPAFDDTFVAVYPQDGLNLSTPQGMAYLRQKVRRHRPELVVLAPWKDMHNGFSGPMGGEAEFMQVKRGLDVMRRRYGFALWIEAHTSSDARNSQVAEHYQPRGTQAQVNWVTYGFALIPRVDDDDNPIPGVWRFDTWRNPRDRAREFPAQLREGRTWPWMPVEAAPTYNHDPLEDFDR